MHVCSATIDMDPGPGPGTKKAAVPVAVGAPFAGISVRALPYSAHVNAYSIHIHLAFQYAFHIAFPGWGFH